MNSGCIGIGDVYDRACGVRCKCVRKDGIEMNRSATINAIHLRGADIRGVCNLEKSTNKIECNLLRSRGVMAKQVVAACLGFVKRAANPVDSDGRATCGRTFHIQDSWADPVAVCKHAIERQSTAREIGCALCYEFNVSGICGAAVKELYCWADARAVIANFNQSVRAAGKTESVLSK